MKKVILVFGAVSLMMLASCKKEEKEVTTESTSTDTTVIIDDNDPPPAPVEDEDGTSISVNADGVRVDSKDGDKRTDVNVDGENSSVEIKR